MKLKEKYKKEVAPSLKEELSLKNAFQCPKIEKVVLNVGIGRWVTKDSSKRDEVIKKISADLMSITGQKPQIRPAKKSISGFSLRQGMPVGLKVTLRGKRMYDFLDRLINIVLPRVRDFQGINLSSIDKCGNLTLGIKEQLVFPEISADNTDFFFSMEVTVVTSADKKDDGLLLLRKMGMPIKKENSKQK